MKPNEDYEVDLLNASMLTLPVMKNLRTLTCVAVEGYNFDYDDDSEEEDEPSPIVHITSEQVPKLEALSIQPWLLKKVLSMKSTFQTVWTIDFNQNAEFDNSAVLHQVLAAFPNLRKITGLCVNMNWHRSHNVSDMYLCDPDEDMGINPMKTIVNCLEKLEIVELELKITRPGRYFVKMDNINNFLSGILDEPKWLLNHLTDLLGAEGIYPLIDPPGPSLRDLKGS